MNPDSQTPTQEPEENGVAPQEPTTGVNETPSVPPTGGDEGGDAMPEAPAPDESDKEDGAKW